MLEQQRTYAVAAVVALTVQATLSGSAEAAGLSKKQLENAVYIIPSIGELPDEKWTLKNGQAKKDGTQVGVLNTVEGALGKPPQDAGAVVFYQNTGGSGDFMYVEAFVLKHGKVQGIAYKPIGDRSTVNSLSIKNGEIVLDMIAHGPSDPAINPSLHRVVHYKLVKDKLVGPDVY